jgi:hypothetical protein
MFWSTNPGEGAVTETEGALLLGLNTDTVAVVVAVLNKPPESVAVSVTEYVPAAEYACVTDMPDPAGLPSPKSQEYVNGSPSGSDVPIALRVSTSPMMPA